MGQAAGEIRPPLGLDTRGGLQDGPLDGALRREPVLGEIRPLDAHRRCGVMGRGAERLRRRHQRLHAQQDVRPLHADRVA